MYVCVCMRAYVVVVVLINSVSDASWFGVNIFGGFLYLEAFIYLLGFISLGLLCFFCFGFFGGFFDFLVGWCFFDFLGFLFLDFFMDFFDFLDFSTIFFLAFALLFLTKMDTFFKILLQFFFFGVYWLALMK